MLGDKDAASYDHFVNTWPLYRTMAASIVDRADLREGQTILDLGCGTGIICRTAADRVSKKLNFVCIDSSNSMISLASTYAQLSQATFITGNAEDVLSSIVASSVDRCVSGYALWHMDTETVFPSVHRILVPGGAMIFNWPGGSKEQVSAPRRILSRLYSKLDYKMEPAGRAASVRSIQQQAEEAGFVVKHHIDTEVEMSLEEEVFWLLMPAMRRGRFESISQVDLEAGILQSYAEERTLDGERPSRLTNTIYVLEKAIS